MNKKILFAALLLAALSIGFIACDNDDDPRLDNDDDNTENVVDDDYYNCDSTEMVCTGKAYDITNRGARIDATINIPAALMASAKIGIQISTNLKDLKDHTNIKNYATTNLTSNKFTIILETLASGTTYYYCAYVYVNDIYIYGLIRELKTLGESENGHGYVDLGLPSGLKWAACNVGAMCIEDYGDYFAWGETEPKTIYNWSTYKWCNGSDDTLTKYNTESDYGTVDNKTVLDLEDDAARTNWGGAWRMPTSAEWSELRNKCTWRWTDGYNGTNVKGRIVTSKINGNSIFLPAAGYRSNVNVDLAGGGGDYWSSSLNTYKPYWAWALDFNSSSVVLDNDFRYYYRYVGRSVRPVLGE